MGREVMQKVLKTLQRARDNFEDSWIDAIADIAAELDLIPDAGKMVMPEPVLFIHPSTLEMASAHVGAWKPGHELPGYIALYAAPPQRQPLTDEEIEALADRHLDVGDGERHHHFVTGDIDFARAIEAAHEIKEQS